MARKYRMMRCRSCGFPRVVNLFIKWNSNGTITQMMRKDYRVVILPHGFIDNLFSQIDSRLGLPIEHIAFEAQRNASKAVFQAFYDRIPVTKYLVKPGFMKRIGVEQFNKVAVITGQCNSKTIEYVPGKYGIARMKNPFHIDLMAANVVGAFETLEGIPFSHTWKEEPDGSYIIRVDATGEKPEIAKRMELEFGKILPGNRVLKRCNRCSAPLGVSHLKWLEDDGVILDTKAGSRVIFLDAYMVSTVLRELTKELGEVIDEIVVEAQRDWAVEHIKQLGLVGHEVPPSEEDFRRKFVDYLELIPLYGWGNPVSISASSERSQVVIENPYERHILAGTFKGLRDALLRSKSKVEFKEDRPGVISYTIEEA